MSNGTAASPNEAVDLRIDDQSLQVTLRDGRKHTVPIGFYPTLRSASKEQRKNWRFIGRGTGIHWPVIDLDLTIEGILEGNREEFPPPPHRHSEAREVDVIVKHEGPAWVVLWQVKSTSRAMVRPTKTQAIKEARALANRNALARVWVEAKGGGVKRLRAKNASSPRGRH